MRTIWLSSYPKAGNTWITSFLYYYYFGIPEHSSEIMLKIPDIHELLGKKQMLNEDSPDTIMCKSHFLFSDKHPQIHSTSGFIYLLRHPKDILLSDLSFWKLCHPETRIDDYRFAISFIENDGNLAWSELGFGSWPQHVSSWFHAFEKYPGLQIRYEDLMKDPQEFRKIIQFLSNDGVDEARFKIAINASSFQSMRNMEIQEKQESIKDTIFPGGESSLKSEKYFVNKGGVGQSLAHIGSDLDEMFDNKYAEILSQLGY